MGRDNYKDVKIISDQSKANRDQISFLKKQNVKPKANVVSNMVKNNWKTMLNLGITNQKQEYISRCSLWNKQKINNFKLNGKKNSMYTCLKRG